MVSEFFQGKPLPPLRPNRVWGFRMWPGGRTELKQVSPTLIATVDAALASLDEGIFVTVSLADAKELVTKRLDNRRQHESTTSTKV